MKYVYILVIFVLLVLLFWTNRQELKREYPTILKPAIIQLEKVQKDLVKKHQKGDRIVHSKFF